jgi:hypothetical protein
MDRIAAVGHPEPLRTIVHIALSRHDKVWATPTTCSRPATTKLLRITAGEVGEVGVK